MDAPQRIGFIGLGIMGGPMAANLIKAGYRVTGYNRSPAAVQRLAGLGGRAATSIAEAVRDADVVITVLPDTPDVEAVVLGDAGVLAHASRGLLHIDMSTISPAASRSIAGQAAAAGVRSLDAPVSGGEQGAAEGTLSIMVGGQAADVEASRPVLEAMGTTVVHVGPAGAGQIVKAANQLLVAGIIELVAEALVLVEANGVDPEPAVRVLAGGLAGNRILDRKAAGMLARDFTPGFRVDLHHKDLGIMLAAARQSGVIIPLGSVVAQLMGAVRAQGDGGSDHTALLKLVERLSGRLPSRTEGNS